MIPMSQAEKEQHLRKSARGACVLGAIEGLLLLAIWKIPSSGLFGVLHMFLLVIFVTLLLPLGFSLIIVIFAPSATFRKDLSSPNRVSISWGTSQAVGNLAYREWESTHRRNSDQPKDEPPEES